MSLPARAYIVLTVLAGTLAFQAGLGDRHVQDPTRFVCYLAVALLSSGFKVTLPGVTGTLSPNFFFILIGVSSMSLGETLAIACLSAISQSFLRARTRPQFSKVVFNVANLAVAITASYRTYHVADARAMGLQQPLLLLLAACVYFAFNTFPVSVIISLTENRRFVKIWTECYFWSLPYYLVGAAVASLVSLADRYVGWQTSLLIFPMIYWLYHSYRRYLARLADGQKSVEELAELQLRTIEALALAIEAKDFTTHSHLRRLGVYAVEIGKELGLAEGDLKALRAAALLHDVGKLAVPEHIISKPGRLTQVEFEKMKIHPLVGAEILEQVDFPYPVVPIVRSHHERWDGSGYPAGLKGEEIPIGARILSVVDALDALSTYRPYRRALSLEDAMAVVDADCGKSFDPRVVEVLRRRYRELEKMVRAEHIDSARLSRNPRADRGPAPAPHLVKLESAVRGARAASLTPDFLSAIAAARQEAQSLFELTHDLGNSLSLDETLSLLAARLKKLCPNDCIAIYVRRGDVLMPEYVSGENFRLFSSLEIPVGEGLSGWVAENKEPIVNGNPSVEPGYLNDPNTFSTLQSALSVPLEGVSGVVGVLTLYNNEKDAFTADHLRILLTVTNKLALSIENAIKYQQAESSATTDALTGLPNARSLFLHLENELARCRRQGIPLAVLVCDLDGFKQINDRFGHLEGNRILRTVAQGLRDHCREYDYVARMGGDEFVVLLPGYDPAAVDTKALLLNEVCVETGRRLYGEELLSLSVGEASFPEDGVDSEQLLAEADRRMYKSKNEQKSIRVAGPWKGRAAAALTP